MKRKLAPLSIFLSLLLIFNISCSVFASGSSTDMQYNELYAYYMADVYGGVDFSQYQDTDEGSSLADIWNRYGTNQFESTIDYYANSMKNVVNSDGFDEYASNQIDYTADYAKNSFRNTVTTANSVNQYIGEKARRTITDNGRKFFNVSGDDWFNSIYNSLFNNDGYNQQYGQSEGSGEYSGEAFGHSYSIKIADNPTQLERTGTQSNFILGFYSDVYSVSYWTFLVTLNVDGETYYSTAFGVTDQYKCRTNRVYVIGNTIYLDVDYGYLDYYNNHVVLQYQFASGSPGNGDLTESGGEVVPKPKSCGVINYNGEWVDVATDPNDRQPPGIINPDGTFTDDQGNNYPIFIEEPGDGEDPSPGELSDPGVWQIIKTVGDNPFGNNYNDPNATYSGDNSGGSSSNPFGLSIKDFFDNIGKGVGNALSKLFDGLIDLLKKVFEIIKNLFSLNFLSSLTLDIDLDFTLLTDIFQNILDSLGVST